VSVAASSRVGGSLLGRLLVLIAAVACLDAHASAKDVTRSLDDATLEAALLLDTAADDAEDGDAGEACAVSLLQRSPRRNGLAPRQEDIPASAPAQKAAKYRAAARVKRAGSGSASGSGSGPAAASDTAQAAASAASAASAAVPGRSPEPNEPNASGNANVSSVLLSNETAAAFNSSVAGVADAALQEQEQAPPKLKLVNTATFDAAPWEDASAEDATKSGSIRSSGSSNSNSSNSNSTGSISAIEQKGIAGSSAATQPLTLEDWSKEAEWQESSDSGFGRYIMPEGLLTRQGGVLIALLLLVVALLSLTLALLARLLALGQELLSEPQSSTRGGSARGHVEAMPRCTALEIEQRLAIVGGYDCALSRPIHSGHELRIEVRVERPVAGEALVAPLTGRSCVLYSATAARKEPGSRPLAYAWRSTDFIVSLLDTPSVHVDVQGDDVLLFDMKAGKMTESMPLGSASDKWKAFIREFALPRSGLGLGLGLTDGPVSPEPVEFQECALPIGAVITLVGELHRDSSGSLSMRPQSYGGKVGFSSARQEPWQTSWECGATDSKAAAAMAAGATAIPWEAQVSSTRVLASDDPKLLRGTARSGLWGRIGACTAAGGALERICAPWSSLSAT